MRWVWRVVLAVVVGVVVNVGVAWWFIAWRPMHQSAMQSSSVVFPSGERVPIMRHQQLGRDWMKWHLYMNRLPNFAEKFPIAAAPWWSEIAKRPDYRTPQFVNVRVEVAAGWPMRSLRWCCWVQDPPGKFIFEPRWCAYELNEFSSVPTWHYARHRILPLMPAWRGFVVNTALYAALAMGVMAVPRWVVRGRRRRRGLCVWCGYPRPAAGEGVCSECGKGQLRAG